MVGAQLRPTASWSRSTGFAAALDLVSQGHAFVFPPTLCSLIMNLMNIETSGKRRAADAISKRSGTTESLSFSSLSV